MSKLVNGFKSYRELADLIFSFAKNLKKEGVSTIGGNAMLDRLAKEDGFYNRKSLEDSFSYRANINKKEDVLKQFHEEIVDYIMLGMSNVYKHEDTIDFFNEKQDINIYGFFTDEDNICFDEKMFGFYDFSSEISSYKLADVLPPEFVNNGWSECDDTCWAMDSVVKSAITLETRNVFREAIIPELFESLRKQNLNTYESNEDNIRNVVFNVVSNNI